MIRGRMEISSESFPSRRANKMGFGVHLPAPGLEFFACVNGLSFSCWHRDLDECVVLVSIHLNYWNRSQLRAILEARIG